MEEPEEKGTRWIKKHVQFAMGVSGLASFGLFPRLSRMAVKSELPALRRVQDLSVSRSLRTRCVRSPEMELGEMGEMGEMGGREGETGSLFFSPIYDPVPRLLRASPVPSSPVHGG
jgi:hypothetical protein